MLAARIRNWGFLATDALRGSPILRHCRDIEDALAHGREAEGRLESLLEFAVCHTPFYAPFRQFASLSDFPVIDKAALKSNPDAFRSDVFRGARLHVMRTSGSTGTPLAVPQDPEKRWRALAEMICFGRRAGYEIGDRYVFTRVWTPHNRKPRNVAWRENAIMFDISSLDESRLETLRRLLLKDRGIRCLIGYPSTFGPLLRLVEAHGDEPGAFNLRCIISISERLPPQLREGLRTRFGCTVVSRYSNQENGVLAQQCAERDEYHVNTASYVLDYLKLDRDLPAAPGERARVVVTDLFNRAMPMIRYDTGDVVIRQPGATCGWQTDTLYEIEGRQMDFIYDTRDRLLSPVVVVNTFWPFTQLRQFQFLQESRGAYRILLDGAREHYPDEAFLQLARSFLGEDAEVVVEHVERIPPLASGKAKVVASRYRPGA